MLRALGHHRLAHTTKPCKAQFFSALFTLLFAKPQPVPYDVPFGKCVFMDATFLPGTITFELFGHEIELLPRALIIDRQEHRWQPNATIPLPHAPSTPTQAKP